MFYGCTSLTTAPELPATSLVEWCYHYMFYNTNVLPDCRAIDFSKSTVVSSKGLYGLFAGTKVTDDDLFAILPISTNGRYYLPVNYLLYAYYQMFQDCKYLTTAPDLPATILGNQTYQSMFSGCTSLTTAPELPATSIGNHSYDCMFKGCTSLTTAPELPATSVGSNAYYYMFYGCTSLTTAPELPATRVGNKGYYSMFQDCTSLTTAPSVLPATTLGQECYFRMFSGCTSLTTAPSVLPATTLATYCYSGMFQGCTSLTTAPELPATSLAINCYQSMFYNCKLIDRIVVGIIEITNKTWVTGWISGVAGEGVFVMSKEATWNPEDYRGTIVPNGWTIEYI